MAKPSPLENHLDIVGILTDREVAIMLGMTAENVRAWRNRRGIAAEWRKEASGASPAAPEVDKATRSSKASSSPSSRSSALDKFDHLLGVVPDATIAHFTGLRVATVGKARAKRGLPAPAKADGPPPRHRRSKMDPYLHMLGQVQDSKIADLSGVSAKNVSNFRRRHGIPSARQLTRPGSEVIEESPAPEIVIEAPVAPVASALLPVAGDGVQWAFKATVERGGVDQTYVVFGLDLAEAAALAASRIGAEDRLTMMESVATVL